MRDTDRLWDPGPQCVPTIDVIERAAPRDVPPDAYTVPFGFSRALLEPTREQTAPLTAKLQANQGATEEAEDKLRWIGVLEAYAALGRDFAGPQQL